MQPEKSISLLNEEVMAQHAEKIEGLTKSFEMLSKENVELRKALANKSNAEQLPKAKPVVPNDLFKVGGKSYRFVLAQVIIDKKTITATDALTDEVMLAHLVKIGSGVLEEVAE
jgi:hypothetical protein